MRDLEEALNYRLGSLSLWERAGEDEPRPYRG